jgi:ATP-dependent Clp protease ATP-binding subunit ClpB
VARLVGAPPGYVGYEEGGQLTERVRRRPYAVLLLDEIEKAHAAVYDLLLQVLDEGRLTDGQGRAADFTNTVIVMTSNLPARGDLRAALRGRFRPEFLNRLDEIVVFSSLERAELEAIARLQLARLAERVAAQGVKLEVDAAATALLARLGYDPEFGARPLARAIDRLVAEPLSRRMLAGEIGAGDRARVTARGAAISVLGRLAGDEEAVAGVEAAGHVVDRDVEAEGGQVAR